jgi:hypothetical protein
LAADEVTIPARATKHALASPLIGLVFTSLVKWWRTLTMDPSLSGHLRQIPQGFVLTTAIGVVGSVVATFLGRAIYWYVVMREPLL